MSPPLTKASLAVIPLRTRTISCIAAALVAAHFPAPIDADTTLTYTDGNRVGTLRIGAGKIRFDPPTAGEWWLFDATQREMVWIDTGKREYTRIDEATLSTLYESVESVVSTVESQMDQLPPSVRDQMRRMMRGVAPRSDEPALRVESSGTQSSVRGLKCDVHRVTTKGKLRGEICLAPVSALGLDATDRTTLAAFRDFARTMTSGASRYVSIESGILADPGRLPVTFRNRRERAPYLLSDVSHSPVDPTTLDIPPGYRRGALPLQIP